MRVRFAPSPTGHLHVGNARTALFNWLLARRHGGTFVLRIEDTDAERSSVASERGILEDLRWLGLEWDEGPDVGGPWAPYRQSERLGLYREHADRLLASGRAYWCFCTPGQLERDRAEALAAGLVPRYPGRCRELGAADRQSRLDAGEPAAVRFHVPPGPDVVFEDRVRGRVSVGRDQIGDPVILRSDGRPAYNFAVVVDDALMGVSHVIRGEDHVSNTPRQVLLYEALGYAAPEFAHLSLVMGPDHTPLSKRHGATSVAEFRARGYLPEALVNYLALIGWSPGHDEEILPIAELTRRFAIEDVGKRAGVFDEAKLAWMNRQYMKQADPARLGALLVPYLQEAGAVVAPVDAAGREYVTSLVPMVAGAVDRLELAPQRLGFLFRFEAARLAADPASRAELTVEPAWAVVSALAEELDGAPPMTDRDGFRALAARVRGRTGQKSRGLFHPIRLALTGDSDGPELDLAVPAIERGALLPRGAGIAPIQPCRERAAALVRALRQAAGGQP
jgi:glutamyl-tRNA synthetase